MIDHLIRCATAEDAGALIERFGASRAFETRAVLADAVWDMSDPDEPVLVSPEIAAEGFHVWIALDVLDEDLRGLPDAACRLVADRQLGVEGATFADVLLYHAPDIGPEVLASARIEPVPAGADYPFRREAEI